jgi:PTS system mannose-specific IIC component
MGILGGALPAIGIVMLLTAVVKEDIMLIFFVFGFICVIFLKLNMIALAVVAGVIAYIYFQAKSKPVVKIATEEGSYDDIDEEEEF